MIFHRRFFSAAAAILVALACARFETGCSTGMDAGTVVYVRGDLETSVAASLEQALGASRRAIEQLQFTNVSEKPDAPVTTLLARSADDKRIEIRVEPQGSGHAKIAIRVGIVGDEALSRTILARIKANL